MNADSIPLVVLVGPTGVGKTALALSLAERIHLEVISADSRQVYRYMDIGTAKPSTEEQRRVRHHLIDIVDPDEEFTLAQYQALAYEAIEEIWSRGALPLLVGGTGLYVKAVVEGWTIPRVPPDSALRRRLEDLAEAEGAAALHQRLRTLDPVAAARIDPRNVRRVIRALEVCERMDQPISDLQRKEPPPYRILQLGLTMPRPLLYERIDRRVDEMIARGLVAEVEGLVARGYHYDLPSMSGLGYRQIGAYLQGKMSLAEAIADIKRQTRRFVRQQYNWFRLSDPRIRWLDGTTLPTDAAEQAIRAHVGAGERVRVTAP
ncbi:MAG: tRNA (adenosine(37)-N6)-dimethylallyltransferase MiaA [Chloroflexi bacterium]|nr:tRNA (adenosine(37)-N6)-dimethylallyltransferase MiaA [Chloroflexota bacterium]